MWRRYVITDMGSCPKWLGINELPKYFGLSATTFRKLERTYNDFPSVRIGKRILVNTIDLDKWFEERMKSNAT